MATELDHISAYPIPPGEHLAEELEAREISLAAFGPQVGLPDDALRMLISGECALTPEIASRIDAALDIPAHIWLGLERRYRAALARREAILRERSSRA